MLSMDQLSLAGKRVLIREDLNVPLRDGRVANDARLRAAVPTIEAAVAAGAGVILMSHLGRPVEGEASDEFSLSPVADALSALLGLPVTLKSEWPTDAPQAGDVWLLENVRFNVGEKANSDELAKRYAGLMRCVCHGCLRHGSSRASIDARCCQICPSSLRWPAASGRA